VHMTKKVSGHEERSAVRAGPQCDRAAHHRPPITSEMEAAMHSELTRTEELLETLRGPVRCMTQEQIERTWFLHTKTPAASAQRVLRRLLKAGLIFVHRAMLPSAVDLQTPLLDWHPGSPEPETLERIAWKSRKRLSGPARTTTVVTCCGAPSKQHAKARRRAIRRSELAHDALLVTALFLRLKATDPVLAATWRSEDELSEWGGPTAGEMVPDAIVTTSEGDMALECIGRNYRAKMPLIHRELRHGRYQMW
jgi:hypothetical protein